MPSGDPRKQPRPDGVRHPPDAVTLVTEHFPPSLSGVMTQIGHQVVPFPAFVGGKAVDLQVDCGPLSLHLHIDPAAIEDVIEELRQAKMRVDTDLRPATMAEVAKAGSHVAGDRNGAEA